MHAYIYAYNYICARCMIVSSTNIIRPHLHASVFIALRLPMQCSKQNSSQRCYRCLQAPARGTLSLPGFSFGWWSYQLVSFISYFSLSVDLHSRHQVFNSTSSRIIYSYAVCAGEPAHPLHCIEQPYPSSVPGWQ